MWLVFGQTIHHSFVNFDDEVYVYRNPRILAGLTSDAIVWAFTHAHARNWHPLTTISHMLDCQMFGLSAGGHHFTNVVLHAIAVVLLFFAWQAMTGAVWRSAFAIAVFAVHPLRAESVAWVAERKDVLSAVFFATGLCVYLWFTRAPRRRGRYAAVVLTYAAGLLAKPMLVTFPLVLLLLDYWPLRRLDLARADTMWRCAREKVSLLVLSAASCIATFIAQRGDALDPLPLSWRIENALITPVIYLRQFFWPRNLAAFYPAEDRSLGQAVAACVLLATISIVAILRRDKWPWLLTGWFWYLIMLLPVSGIVQIGMQSHADRYTYLPQIGIAVAVIWTIAEVAQGARCLRQTAAIGGAVTIVMAFTAWRQTHVWRDSAALWQHASEVTRDNEVAENNLGVLLEEQGRFDEALAHVQCAVAMQEQHHHSRYALSLALSENNIANVLARKGEPAEAVAHYHKAIELRPDYGDALYNMAVLLLEQHDVAHAAEALQKASALMPDDAAVHGQLGDALRHQHDEAGALREYQKALQLAPNALWANYDLAWLLATSTDAAVRDGARAVQIADRALRLKDGQTSAMLRALAAGYAAEGNFTAASSIAADAAGLAAAQRDGESLHRLRGDLDLYRSDIPVREFAGMNER